MEMKSPRWTDGPLSFSAEQSLNFPKMEGSKKDDSVSINLTIGL